MTCKGLLTAFLLFAFFHVLSAQTKDYPWAIGIHPSIFSFFSLDQELLEGRKYDFGFSLSGSRYMNSSFNLEALASFATLRFPHDNAAPLEPLRKENFYSFSPMIRYKVNNGYILDEDLFFGPFLKTGLGISKSDATDSPGVFLPFGVGINFQLGNIASLDLESTYNMGLAGTEDYFQSALGLKLHLNSRGRKTFKHPTTALDRDSDGVPDNVDRCPDIAGFIEGNGCPDQDGDGVFDDADECPGIKGYANLVGCLDIDNDGLIDPDDGCPDSFGPIDLEGCPPQDKDGDRIPDIEDECPELPGLFTAKGCPDSDGDGIRDSDDACPKEYGLLADDGCPVMKPGTKPVMIPNTGQSLDLTDACNRSYLFLGDIGRNIYFASNSSTLLDESIASLDLMSELMLQCTEHELLITAHTDSDGEEGYNLKLSGKRAQEVKKYLVGKGVDISRIKTAAFGESQPLYPNDTDENKRKNRRVEFSMFR